MAAHAYTPGLRITEHTTVRRRRLLPLKGTVIVQQGEAVRADTIVARTELPGKMFPVNVVNRLNCAASELARYMLKNPGDPVAANEVIAETQPFIKWFKSVCRSPVEGTVESISSVTGQVMIREPARPVEIAAYIDGTVVAVLPEDAVEA